MMVVVVVVVVADVLVLAVLVVVVVPVVVLVGQSAIGVASRAVYGCMSICVFVVVYLLGVAFVPRMAPDGK